MNVGPIETFEVHVPGVGVYLGELRRTSRPGGRRIIARDGEGKIVFDTSDCFDGQNAANALDQWLTEKIALRLPDRRAAGVWVYTVKT